MNIHPATAAAVMFSAAATIVTLSAKAQEKAPCAEITFDMPYLNGTFVIHQRMDTEKNLFCLSVTSENPLIRGTQVKVTDGTGAVTTKDENCLDMKGAATQLLSPVTTFADNDVQEWPALGMEQATEVFNEMSSSCMAAHPSSYEKIRFNAPSL